MSSANVLALIPARSGSKGIPRKNFKPLAGKAPLQRALECAHAIAGVTVISTDERPLIAVGEGVGVVYRPPELAADDTPMIDVVKHALAEIPGPDDQIILLVQPTQPLRQPKHLTAAIELLQSSGADSVVSVVEIPATHHPRVVCTVVGPLLYPYGPGRFSGLPATRQSVDPVYVRDGTCYAFWRSTVATHGSLYGQRVRPLIIPPEETCPLDTPADWAEAERRLRAL